MRGFFDDVWEKLKITVKRELEDLSYMEIVTATSDKVENHLDGEGWDILDSLRRGNPPPASEKKNITVNDMLNLSNVNVLARTRIELDGDVFFLLKSKDGIPTALSKEVMEFHKMGVDISVKNWQMFLQFVLEMTETIGTIVGDPSIKTSSKPRN
jgi:hypothetical protein